ncbi:MAG: WavE lipopolysaccharide synthesis family protein [Clostridium sp.]|nr:WavE lipopolysaccharide synthesis family protein [Clostridium sp.]
MPASTISDIAIVIQGPIKYEDDFTLETVKLYRKMFPNCLVIVSTWSDEDVGMLNKISELGAVVLESDMPEHMTGLDFSVNLQRKNTLKGMEYAFRQGVKYCVKTRCDQRFYSNKALEYCREMLESIPLGDNNVSAKGRVISSSLGTFINRYYNVSDLFLFGYTEDLLLYFSCPEDLREHIISEPAKNMLEYCKRLTGEIWFSTHYLEKIGHKLLWTREDSNYVFSKIFIIIDAESIDLFWPKYTESEYRWRRYNKGEMILEQLSFADWFLLYQNCKQSTF